MKIITIITCIIMIFIFIGSANILLREQSDNIIQYCENNQDGSLNGDLEVECKELLIDVYGINYCNMTFINCSSTRLIK